MIFALNQIINKMEIINIFDKIGNRTGTSSKEKAHSNNLWHEAVNIWIFNKEGKVLLQKRSLNKLQYPNTWSCSVGGHVRIDESCLDAAIRELKEELNLIFNKSDLNHITSYSYTNNKNSEHLKVYVIQTDIEVSKINFNKDEVADVKYVDLNLLDIELKKNTDNFLINNYEFTKIYKYLNNKFSSKSPFK